MQEIRLGVSFESEEGTVSSSQIAACEFMKEGKLSKEVWEETSFPYLENTKCTRNL